MGWVAAIPADNGDGQTSDLAARLFRGEPGALEEMIALYGHRVGRLANRLLGYGNVQEAEDVVQEVFLAAWEGRKRYRGDASAWTYLAAITANRCRSRWRKRRAIVQSHEAEDDAADKRAIAAETNGKVRNAVAYLPRKLREAAVFYYLEQMPVAEICRVLHASQAAIEVRLHRARRQLKELLSDLKA